MRNWFSVNIKKHQYIHERYQNFTKKKKKKQKYGLEQFLRSKKQRTAEYTRILWKGYYQIKKNKNCYKHLKWDLSYQFVQMNATTSFLKKVEELGYQYFKMDSEGCFFSRKYKKLSVDWLFLESVRNFGSLKSFGGPGFSGLDCSIYNY